MSRGAAELCAPWRGVSPARGLRILLYHTLGTRVDADTYGMNVSPERFRAHMLALARCASVRVVPLEPGRLGSDDGLQVALTFDDGYRDTLTTAAPLLAELGMPFTVFVVPDYVMSGHPAYLTAVQLRELAAMRGCQIGSHGLPHARLTELDDGALMRELSESRRWLEACVSRPVTALAYPHGSVNPRVMAAAARCGYTIGVCSRAGINRVADHSLRLRRTELLGRDTPRIFLQKLSGAWDWARWRR